MHINECLDLIQIDDFFHNFIDINNIDLESQHYFEIMEEV
jgi:hypothetical protein